MPRTTIVQSKHCRAAEFVNNVPEEWCVPIKIAQPDGHVSRGTNDGPASRVYDETWTVRGGHIVRS